MIDVDNKPVLQSFRKGRLKKSTIHELKEKMVLLEIEANSTVKLQRVPTT